ncbi:PDR/VanB family oxidoreductase [Blastococcus sp. KM273129]|uniref:PDR/VanB family oxidoreductase n=1 Tax=Blastococcus sp. KM273129 TaxID=2570315 RepID=UPI001F286459|nr:PDR/VanB family oxidoreductase [Blastococcus sp. KM273129]MCF6736495.1 oxidoreductase [Blastococcus sp. KM273129]
MSVPATQLLRVTRIRAVTDRVREIRLADPDGRPLAGYAPGSHLVVTAGGTRNAYSLTGSGIAPGDYRISVLRTGDDGGSAWLHDVLRAGDLLAVEPPRSAFRPELAARKSFLVAAGIGVTPILSHLAAARAWGRPVEVVYGYRPGEAAHLEEVRQLAGPDLVEAQGRVALADALRERMAVQPWGTHAYACGPAAVLDLFTATARAAGWPPARVHLEHFRAPELSPGRPFTARLRRSGREFPVPSGTSLLDAVLAAGVEVPSMCRQGVCGQCLVPVAAGRVEHRDLVLDEADRLASTHLLACVSRAADTHLELDL